MGWGIRFFVFGDDGSLRRLPLKLTEELAVGQTSLPEFAGQTLRVAEVLLDTEGGKPVRVAHVMGSLWRFDERGSIQRHSSRAAIEAMQTHEALQKETASGAGPVVQISARLARRRWEQQHRWEPTPADITRMIHAIWPKSAGRPAEPLRSIKTNWKRRTPVSYEAKNALSECWTHVIAIGHQIEDLSDESLKGFVESGRSDSAGDDFLHSPLWEGIARAAEREILRRKAWKTQKGRWFAVAERTIWEDRDMSEGKVDLLEFVECDGKAAAVEACRQLLKKYADQFDERISIEVEIRPEIEWRPPDE